jgi:hypothetical protein
MGAEVSEWATCRTAEVHLLLGMAVRLLKLKSMLNACLSNSILYCCFKYVDFYICKCFEFNAIPCDACFAEFLPKCLG